MKRIFIYFSIITLLTACSSQTPVNINTKKVIGPPNEIRTVALVLKRFYSTTEIKNLLINSGSSLIGLDFYSDRITASIGFEADTLAAQLSEYETLKADIGIDTKKHIQRIILEEFSKITKKEFISSKNLQEEAKYLLTDLEAAKSFMKASRQHKAMVYIITLRAKIKELNSIAANSGYEGIVDYQAIRNRYGNNLKIIPRAKFLEAIYNRDFDPEYYKIAPDIFNEIQKIILENQKPSNTPDSYQ